MITVLSGENTFEIERVLIKIVDDFDGEAEKRDGVDLELRQLPDLLMGTTLFAHKRLVIIRDLSANKSVWTDLAHWLALTSDDIHLVLVEPKLDKRTKTYKELQKIAKIIESTLFTERNSTQVERWVINESSKIGFSLDAKSAQFLVSRIGVDQWALYQALQKLAVIDAVNPAVIKDIIDANPTENVFNLLDAAMKRDVEAVSRMVRTLSLTEDPYRLFGLMSGQVFQLFTFFVSDKRDSDVAKDLGIHPYALSKFSPYASSLERADVERMVSVFIEADDGLKTSVGEPWLLLERALMKIATS